MQNLDCSKKLNFKNFPKIQIGVETSVDDLHFVSWTQI